MVKSNFNILFLVRVGKKSLATYTKFFHFELNTLRWCLNNYEKLLTNDLSSFLKSVRRVKLTKVNKSRDCTNICCPKRGLKCLKFGARQHCCSHNLKFREDDE